MVPARPALSRPGVSGDFTSWESGVMGRASTNYPRELRERAVLMVAEVGAEYPSEWAAIGAVARKLAIGSAETLRKWVRQGARRATPRAASSASSEHPESARGEFGPCRDSRHGWRYA
jgi:transposase